MKILPINIFNNHIYKPSFKAGMVEDANSYDRIDSYVDGTGLHYVHNRVHYPWNEPWDEQINDTFEERPLSHGTKSVKEPTKNLQGFLTQDIYDRINRSSEYKLLREDVQKALYDMDLEGASNIIMNANWGYVSSIMKEPFFILRLADIPVTDKNKDLYYEMLNHLKNKAGLSANVMDENGITLLEKVMNSENETFLDIIREVAMINGVGPYSASITYHPMQKYAFDNIQNRKFKEKCKNLPMQFYDIINDIERKDLKSLDEHIHEQMKCGFCDIQHSLHCTLYAQAYKVTREKTYPRLVLDIAQKHFPFEVDRFLNKVTRRF